MSVNLLPQATVKDLKKADSSLRGLIVAFVWIGILVVVFVFLFFNESVAKGKLRDSESNKTELLTQISELGQTQDDYYTLAYKTMILSRIKTDQYVPSTIGSYVKERIEGTGKIQQYYFDAKGVIRLQIETNSYYSAVKIWHELLKDKNVVSELNLTSFSQDVKGKVSFQLTGTLNLAELYIEHGITK